MVLVFVHVIRIFLIRLQTLGKCAKFCRLDSQKAFDFGSGSKCNIFQV